MGGRFCRIAWKIAIRIFRNIAQSNRCITSFLYRGVTRDPIYWRRTGKITAGFFPTTLVLKGAEWQLRGKESASQTAYEFP
jgi:hypothetical protein